MCLGWEPFFDGVLSEGRAQKATGKPSDAGPLRLFSWKGCLFRKGYQNAVPVSEGVHVAVSGPEKQNAAPQKHW